MTMRNLFHRRDSRHSDGSDGGVEIKERRSSFFRRRNRQSVGSNDSIEIKERRSSIFRRHLRISEDCELVELMRPRDTVVTRISESSESPQGHRRRRRRNAP
ncbi:hypothetical protein GN244_ATG05857 [Phytophthora infestans]|uniref:Uncharacterized protein n=1 Tax=Phytophthora infestans TaxID=4787 RepID=A0A833SIZ3_PHYIN|nr:hypothetical protein GN244_ATG05857 [Phytophthora infestans]KAF4130749.1 hypothetical protein GN958_ATG20054 [Phytophthora infestans]